MNEIWCPLCNGNILGVFVAGSPCLVTLLQIKARFFLLVDLHEKNFRSRVQRTKKSK